MASTASGVTIPGASPTTTPATPIQDHWNNLGKSLNGKVVPTVASVTARAALVTALTADGYTITTATPLYTHRTDAPANFELEVTTNGSTWRPVNTGARAEYFTSATCAADGTFSGTFPGGVFTATPQVLATVQSNSQFAYACAVATSTTAFSGRCGFSNGVGGGVNTSAGFVVAIRAVQAS